MKENIVLTYGASQLEFQPDGSRFLWRYEGVPILGSFQRGDGSEGVSHSCIPVFDADPEGKLKRHGLTRDRTVSPEIALVTFNSIITRTKLTHEKSSLLVIQSYVVTDNAIEVVTDTRNEGDCATPELSGIHPYFNAPWGRANVRFNNQEIAPLMEEDGITQTNPKNTLFIPGMVAAGKVLIVDQYGLPIANAWVGQKPNGTFDENYFAFSFVSANFRDKNQQFRSANSLLEVGESRHTRLTIAVGE